MFCVYQLRGMLLYNYTHYNVSITILFTQNTNDTTILGKWRKVAYIEVIGDVGDVHATCKGHIRTKKTLAEVGKVYKCRCAKICHRQICVIVPCVSMTQM